MTNEEMFNANIGLAYKNFWKYKNCGIEDDDLKQICLYALWKAVVTYNGERGSALSSYVYRVIQNEVNYYLRKNRKYFKDRYFSEEIGENISLEDTLADEYDRIEEVERIIDDKNILKMIDINKLKENEKVVLKLHIQGYKQRKIAEIIHCSQAQVSRYLKSIKKKLGGN